MVNTVWFLSLNLLKVSKNVLGAIQTQYFQGAIQNSVKITRTDAGVELFSEIHGIHCTSTCSSFYKKHAGILSWHCSRDFLACKPSPSPQRKHEKCSSPFTITAIFILLFQHRQRCQPQLSTLNSAF